MNPPGGAPAIATSAPAGNILIGPGGVKGSGRLVGVIADRAALAAALRLRRPPDLFELRLDALQGCIEETERTLPKLRAPLICTARHPDEGGCHGLSGEARRELLLRFLPHARFVDLELRAAGELRSVIAAARSGQVGVIFSQHDLQRTPARSVLSDNLERALERQPDIFKIATRTETAADLERLLDFFRKNSHRIPIAAMGLGALGATSRRRLLRLGSVLNYAALTAANVPGQLTLRQLRRTRAAYHIL